MNCELTCLIRLAEPGGGGSCDRAGLLGLHQTVLLYPLEELLEAGLGLFGLDVLDCLSQLFFQHLEFGTEVVPLPSSRRRFLLERRQLGLGLLELLLIASAALITGKANFEFGRPPEN